MAEIFVDDILQDFEDRLNLIRTSNGYSSAVDGVVKRAPLAPPKADDYPAVSFWSDGFDTAPDAYGRDQQLVRVYVEVREHTHDEPLDRVAGRVSADVATCLHRSVSSPQVSDRPEYNFGDKVEGISLAGCDYYVGEGGKPFCAALLSFIVTTYTLPGDLTQHGPSIAPS